MLDVNLTKALNTILPGKVSICEASINSHAGNQFYSEKYLPDAVCFIENEDDIKSIITFCLKYNIPLIPYGSGTSVEGHLTAIAGGICVDLSKMNRILEFNPDDGYLSVEPGISYNEVNEFLNQYGFHFPVEAGWGASIGGMVATNASGAGAVDSGSMAKNVLGCNAVVYDEDNNAQIIKTGTKSLKPSAGYNLTNLLVGSEGTLGIVSQILLKIRKDFACTNTIVCQFENLEEAIKFVIDMKYQVQFRRAELLDILQTKACIKYSNISQLDVDKFTILIELAGNIIAVNEEKQIILDYLQAKNTFNLQVFDSKTAANVMWMMRKNACPAAIKFINPNKKAIATDICVPLSKLANCIQACYKQMHKYNIIAPLVSHVGDGNFHFTLLVDSGDQHELHKIKEFQMFIVEEALKHQGTCTGEHGIGLGKMLYLEKEHGDYLFLMAKIKKAFDPMNIFNPGKIVAIKNALEFSKENHLSLFSRQNVRI